MTPKEQIDQIEQADTELTDFLKSHEQDIAMSINDFGDLSNIFTLCIGREAAIDGNEG